MVSSVEKDPGLGIDWGYFVEAEPFRQYLLSVTDQKEVRRPALLWNDDIISFLDEHM